MHVTGPFRLINYLRFLATHRTLLAFGFLAFFAGNFGQSFFVAWFGASIQSSLGLSASAYSAAYSAATLCSAMTIIVVGAWIDRVNLALYALLVLTGLGVAMATLSLSQGFASLLVGFFLLRLCGQGLLTHTGMSTMARYFQENRGKAMSIAGTGTPVGEMIMPTLAVLTLGWLGWRGSWALFATLVPLVLLPLFALLLWRISRSHPLHPRDATSETTGTEDDGVRHYRRRDVLRDRRFWRVLPLLLAAPFMVTGLFIHQNFLVAAKDWSPEWLAASFTLYGGMHWAAALASGVLIDRLSARRVLRYFQLPLLSALCVLVTLDAIWVAPVFMFLMGSSMGAGGPLLGALWAEVYGVRHIGAIRSLVQACMVVSTAAAPLLMGLAIDGGVALSTMLWVAIVYLVVAMILARTAYPLPNSRR